MSIVAPVRNPVRKIKTKTIFSPNMNPTRTILPGNVWNDSVFFDIADVHKEAFNMNAIIRVKGVNASDPVVCGNQLHPCLLVMSITTESITLNADLTNLFKLFSYYQKIIPFQVFVFSNSSAIIDACRMNHFVSVADYAKNGYGMPLVNRMLVFMKNHIESDYYGYMNSDCLFHISLFYKLVLMKMVVKEGRMGKQHELASRVSLMKRDYIKLLNNESDYMNRYVSIHNRNLIRAKTSSDIFLFSSSYPLDTIQDIVAGRRHIDIMLLSHPFVNNLSLIDFTYGIKSYHQGYDSFHHHIKSIDREDYNFNYQYQTKSYFIYNSRISLNYDRVRTFYQKKARWDV